MSLNAHARRHEYNNTMVFKRIDNRIRNLIENGVEAKHRSMFVIVGDKAKDQVVILYNILAKAQIKACPSVLWCYKNELSFNNNRKKRLKRIQKKIAQGINDKSENLFDLFIESSKIRFTYYKDSKRILGNTFGMLVLQDFEALTPNIMAHTIETTEGGGVVCILLSTIKSVRQLYTMTMDVHSRYRTESFQDVICRFNERFLLSLNDCLSCLVIDDDINILPIFSKVLNVEKIPKRSLEYISPNNAQHKQLIDSFKDSQPLGTLLELCKTLDQAKVLCKSFEIISPLNTHSVISITAARGRGKSAALGLILAGVTALGLSNMYIVAPSPENLITFFEFLCKGLEKLGYSDKTDYELITTKIDEQKLTIGIKINKNHRQNIQYISPSNSSSIHNAELIMCDEAAAIPLTYVKKLLGHHILVISSTINGYEGTGRSLSLKLIKELRENSSKTATGIPSMSSLCHPLTELTLNESIRYADQDPVENWLNKLLCLTELNAPSIDNVNICSARDCELYYVCRDTLFSYHKVAEMFLQNLTSLFVSSHYKNSPNDLQMMADAPAHHVFVLLPSKQLLKSSLPQILCAIQVCLEGGISGNSVTQNLHRGQRASGDLIPWTISQQFCERDFAHLKGVRIVRIATHPDYTQMGYGTRAIELLSNYFEKSSSIDHKSAMFDHQTDVFSNPSCEALIEECLVPKSKLPPLLVNVNERPGEQLHYIGVSYGLTARLLKFWKRLNFIPVYLRQTSNELTGEFTNIMLRPIISNMPSENVNWLIDYYLDFRTRFLSLLSYSFRDLSPSVALSLLYHNDVIIPPKQLSQKDVDNLLTLHDVKRLESYANNMVDYHFVMDLVPIVSKLHLDGYIHDHQNNWVQLGVILSMGLQHKSLKSIQDEMNIPATQILAMFNKIIRKTVSYLNTIKESAISSIVQDETQPTLKDDIKCAILPRALNSYKVSKDTKTWNEVLESNINPLSVSIARYILIFHHQKP
ncbi:hypothetical protein MXB_1693 [Myxobolus squamalis]|nr:hypothetical protein MXB_1693 [Myxobolus squamalis]